MADLRYYLMHKVVILGCGWLGEQLGVALGRAGYQVFGTRQSINSCASLPEPIQPLVLQLPALEFPSDLVADATVIVALPASTPNYLQALQQISQSCTMANQLFFCSSTGVYAGLAGHLAEAELVTSMALLDKVSLTGDYAQALAAANNPAAHSELSRVQRLLAAEIIMSQQSNVVVLRLAGLIGPGRHPAKFCRHGTLTGPELPVNMLHSFDIQQFLLTWLGQPQTAKALGSVFNLCSPEHPSKRQFYQHACADAGIAEPQFILASDGISAEPARTIDVSLSLCLAGFRYQFVSPISAIAHCLR